MAITDETRKRLWARSGNLCALCRRELIRSDTQESEGARVGEEAHIAARSPGGPRYEPLEPSVRDSYDNLILLCANDHTEVDAQPVRYTAEMMRQLKRDHEAWVRDRLRHDGRRRPVGPIPAVVVLSGSELWDLLEAAFGWQLDSPEGLSEAEEDLIDEVLQECADLADISSDVRDSGLRAVRDAKRSLQKDLEALAAAGFLLLGGRRDVVWGGGLATGPLVALKVVRPSELASLQAPGPDVVAPARTSPSDGEPALG